MGLKNIYYITTKKIDCTLNIIPTLKITIKENFNNNYDSL